MSSSSFLDASVRFFSAEWLLDNRSNGGFVILMRTIWISILVYTVAITLAEIVDPRSTLCFSVFELRERVSGTIPWLGAILGSVYLALYARFASQWSYLAQLYNQLMQVGATTPEASIDQIRLTNWRAGFIEDAFTLHLACKPMFAAAINEMLRKPEILAAYRASTIDSERHLLSLQERFRRRGLRPFEL